jgi:hypothetical protein
LFQGFPIFRDSGIVSRLLYSGIVLGLQVIQVIPILGYIRQELCLLEWILWLLLVQFFRIFLKMGDFGEILQK